MQLYRGLNISKEFYMRETRSEINNLGNIPLIPKFLGVCEIRLIALWHYRNVITRLQTVGK